MTTVWQRVTNPSRSLFGDTVLVAFLLAQVLDGTFTYVAVRTSGLHVEGNPLLSWLMLLVGEGAALTSAKVVASICGIALHLSALHWAVAALTALYLAVAVVPWAAILFFS